MGYGSALTLFMQSQRLHRVWPQCMSEEQYNTCMLVISVDRCIHAFMHSFMGMHIKVYSELFACNAKINNFTRL
jgi:hypothetical protein